jgi:acid phosphatase
MFGRLIGVAVLATVVGAAVLLSTAGSASKKPYPGLATLAKVNHIVVIYEENHSFDNLYGGWEGVNGLAKAKVKQVNQSGNPFNCVLQQDVNLTVPPLVATCTDSTSTPTTFTSHFANASFTIDPLIPATATTCPKPGVFAANGVLSGQGVAGGCTRDLVHRFYQEQYQLDNGKMDRYVTGSDATGLTLGVYDTKALPIYQYLHGKSHPRYAIEDDFFQGAFGGSYLNHQWLVCACAPIWVGAPNDGGANDLHSVVDGNGMPNNYPNYSSPLGGNVRDMNLTASCSPPAGRPAAPAQFACGDYSVNTTQPTSQPFQPGTASTRQLPPLATPTIGDRLTAAKVDWAWYSGGWSNADGEVGAPGWTNGNGPTCSDPYVLSTAVYPYCADGDFQFHHQAFNYYADLAPGTPARKASLRDEVEFMGLAAGSKSSCKLKPVSFIKPIGEENEHPGYASESVGSAHLVTLLKAIEGSACAKDTMVIVTYDEFGGQADHVAPPGTVGGVPGPHDKFGPGSRIPALVVSPMLKSDFVVDSVEHDTSSILTTIEKRWNLKPLGTRDAGVSSLATAFEAKPPKTT